MIGLPVTRAIERAAPPRASPSSLVSTTPSKPTPWAKALAVLTASWPIMASTTKSTSSGWTASRMSTACFIISASMPSRPAVSTMTTSQSDLGLRDRGPPLQPGHHSGDRCRSATRRFRAPGRTRERRLAARPPATG